MAKFLSPLLFVIIGVLVVIVSKKNLSSRKDEMNDNYHDALGILKRKMLSLMPNEEMELNKILSLRELELLKALRENRLSNDAQNPWSAQQGVITVQDIIIKINKVKKSV